MPPFCSMIRKMSIIKGGGWNEQTDRADSRGYEASARRDRAGSDCVCGGKGEKLQNGAVLSVIVRLNSGMYKNAFTCGIPNSRELGSEFAAALGVIAGNWELGLEALWMSGGKI